MKEKDYELLVEIAAREQRHAVVDSMNSRCSYGTRLPDGFTSSIQKAPCPDAQRVLALWRKELSREALTTG